MFCDERKIANNKCSPREECICICMILPIPDRHLEEVLQKLQKARDRHEYQHEIAFKKVENPS